MGKNLPESFKGSLWVYYINTGISKNCNAEIKQSIKLIEEAIKKIPSEKTTAEDDDKILSKIKKIRGQGLGRCERPAGEIIHFVKFDGEKTTLSAWDFRSATFNNILPLVSMLKGAQIQDAPIILHSIDPDISLI